ncbi:alcaligin biosynthesis protein [Cytophagales bacterium RKSG123]|nr:alcaligin biosynthesis protein [Xanthovirga aplysinae]
MEKMEYDFIGIGIGPFNLSLAALADPLKEMNGLFFDQRKNFNWHPGVMLKDTTLQVPFLADFVSMIDPTNRFSFLNYLRENNRIYQFYIRENFFIFRKEYNQYCKWVIRQLTNLKFSHQVENIHYDTRTKKYEVSVIDLINQKTKTYFTKKLVLGTGTTPHLPEFLKNAHADHCLHSSDYLYRKEALLSKNSITIVGSGQSAAEIFLDLAREQKNHRFHLNWFSRPDRFFPLEYSKLTLELTSPDYVDHFYHLPPHKREKILSAQNQLYKGINYDLINEIYDYLYQRSLDQEKIPISLRPCSELFKVEATPGQATELNLHFRHTQLERNFTEPTDALISCTGYKASIPKFIAPIQEQIRWDTKGRYDVHRNYAIDHEGKSIFVQNGELHTHGFVTPDLGMGAQRSASIINSILGYIHYPLEEQIAFQQFGTPSKDMGKEEISDLFNQMSPAN